MKGILLRWLARHDAWCQEWGLTPRTGAAARRYAMMRTRSARRRATTHWNWRVTAPVTLL